MTNIRRRSPVLFAAPLLLLIALSLNADEQGTLVIGDFSSGSLDGWEEKSFSGNTHYQLENGANGQHLKATSNSSASGLFKKIDIDLNKTPYLNWSWRIDNTFKGNNERGKDGDDYPARIYVVISGGVFFWKTRALNYVWSSNQATGSNWPNAYTDNAQMLAVRSGAKQTGHWYNEKRDLLKDLKKYFGEDITKINAIAIMTDSDNTQQKASASFGDIYFSGN